MTTIIALAWNHWKDITKPYIENLMSVTVGEFELIIMNNGSTDETAKDLAEMDKQYKNLKVYSSAKNLGFSGGNNFAYKYAHGEFIVFMNNDVVINDPLWLEKLKDSAGETSIVGPDLVTWNENARFRDECIHYINGWCLAGSKKLFDAVRENGEVFDEGFGLAYFEDVELCARAMYLGYTLKQVDTNLVHLGSKSSGNINKDDVTLKAKRYFHNKMMINYLKASKRKRIVFYFDCTYEFTDGDYEGKGVGGAEASLILLARELAKKGHLVEVYNKTKVKGIFNDVYYDHVSNFKNWVYSDVFVLFRNPSRILRYVNSNVKIFWSCDQWTSGNWKYDTLPYVNKMVCISDYHKKYVEMIHAPIKDGFIQVIDLGVKWKDYNTPSEKEKGKLIYCSVPRRGLKHLSYLFNEIKRRVPYATLYITSDYRLWGQEEPDNYEYIEEFRGREGVYFLGKVSRAELVKHQKTSEVMAYPCNYEECFCISAMECIASGAIPVTTDIGAMKTTVADSGILLSNTPGTTEYDKTFVEEVVSLLTDNKRATALRKSGYNRASKRYRWEVISEEWEKLFTNLSSNMVTCEKCNKSMVNAYILAKHKMKYHPEMVEVPKVDTPEADAIDYQVLKFRQPIEVSINGNRFEGTEVKVPAKYVAAVVEIARNAYGFDVLAI